MSQRILAAIDIEHPDRAEKVITAALKLGGSEAAYCFITVIPDAGHHMVASFLPKDYDKRLKEEMHTRLTSLLEEQINIKYPYETSIRTGTIYEEITELAQSWNADITVIGAGRRHKTNLGGTALRVNQHSATSVLTVR